MDTLVLSLRYHLIELNKHIISNYYQSVPILPLVNVPFWYLKRLPIIQELTTYLYHHMLLQHIELIDE